MKPLNKKSIFELFNFKSYIKEECLFLFFVGTTLVNTILLRLFTVGNLLSAKPVLLDTAFLLFLGAASYYMGARGKKIYLMTLCILLSSIFVIDAMYYNYYSSFTSISLLTTSQQLGGVKDAIVKNVMQFYQFIFFWQPIAMGLYIRRLKKRQDRQEEEPSKAPSKACRRVYFANTILIALAAVSLFTIYATPTDYSRFRSQWYREYIVMQFGACAYHLNDVVQSATPEIYAMTGFDNANQRFHEFFDDRKQSGSKKYKKIFEGRDVYVIHVESMQQFLIDRQFNGEAVTPNLNRLSKEGMYFSNFYAQTSIGTSSDTEFTFNTSLMPATRGTVFINYFDREYVTLPSLLKGKGYYSFSMHGNDKSFWNRATMHANMGYDQVLGKSDYVIDEFIGLGLSDMSFFRQSVPKIKAIKEEQKSPLYATLIMLTNHTPFSDVDKLPAFDVDYKVQTGGAIQSMPYMEGTKMGNYIKSAHYADLAIGQFIEEMDAAGLLDNAVVVIYGDHDAKLSKEDYERLKNYNPETDEVLSPEDSGYVDEDLFTYEMDQKVPFIIWTKDKQFRTEVKEAMGMLDTLPTLGNMLGVKSPYQLGHDIFSDVDNFVPFANGNYLTDLIYYDSQGGSYRAVEESPGLGENFDALLGEPVSQSYLEENSARVDQLIKLSNDIMNYDLIRENKMP